MRHPEELLAEFVDGALDGSALAEARAHVTACGRCRDEVQLASQAREASASLPEAAVPPGLLDGVLAEAEKNVAAKAPQVVPMRRHRAPGVPAWYRWAGVAGVAAAAVLVAVVALPNLRGRDTVIMAETGNGSAPRTATQLELQDVDYDEASVQALIAPLRGDEVLPTAEMGPDAAAADNTYADAGRAEEAVACLDTAFTSLEGEKLIGGERIRLIQARFQGEPAYIGVYLVSPGAGEPANRIAVWVAAVADCSILSVTQATI